MTACTNYDRNVRNYDNRRHDCGWQLYACQHGPELYCAHSHGIGRRENPSRLREYKQACALYARQQDLGDCLWGIRLRCWDDPTHRIEHAYTPIWEHWQAALPRQVLPEPMLTTMQYEELDHLIDALQAEVAEQIHRVRLFMEAFGATTQTNKIEYVLTCVQDDLRRIGNERDDD